MPTKFDMSVEEAMKLLNLNKGFTENELKSNYRKIMMSIHPDKLVNLNDLARKILEEKAKDINMARQVMQGFINTNYIKKNTYSKTSNENNKDQQQKQEKESKEKDYQEQKNTENQSKEKNYQEENNDKRKGKTLNIVVKFIYVLWLSTIILGYSMLKIYGYKVNNSGQVVFISYLAIPIIIFIVLKIKEYKNKNKEKVLIVVLKNIYILWFLSIILAYSLLKIYGYEMNDLGKVIFKSYLTIPIIIFILIKIAKGKKSN